jgi:hypothetical protein
MRLLPWAALRSDSEQPLMGFARWYSTGIHPYYWVSPLLQMEKVLLYAMQGSASSMRKLVVVSQLCQYISPHPS